MIGRTILAVVVVSCGFGPVSAHHSIRAHYDVGNIGEVTGTLESIDWRNPHTIFELSVENEQGEIETWTGEAGSVNTLNRINLSRETLRPGMEITLVGPVSSRGRNEILAARAITETGDYAVFPAASYLLIQPPAESGDPNRVTSAAGYDISIAPAEDIFRVWVPMRFPGTAVYEMEFPLTETGKEALTRYDAAADDLATLCSPPGMPSMLDQPYPVEFIDRGEHITMHFEEWEGHRVIYMDGGPPAGAAATITGISQGSWDGDVLVIETDRIEYPYYDDFGIPLSEDAHVTERYAISEDGMRLEWSAEASNPDVFTDPFTISGWMVYSPDIEIRDFKCSQG